MNKPWFKKKSKSKLTFKRSCARRTTLLARMRSSFLCGFCSICRYRLICKHKRWTMTHMYPTSRVLWEPGNYYSFLVIWCRNEEWRKKIEKKAKYIWKYIWMHSSQEEWSKYKNHFTLSQNGKVKADLTLTKEPTVLEWLPEVASGQIYKPQRHKNMLKTWKLGGNLAATTATTTTGE